MRKLFKKVRSRSLRLPPALRFISSEISIRRDGKTGDVILCRKPGSWDELFARADSVEIPWEFLSQRDRRPSKKRRLF
jgi:antitoxin VapB